MLQSEHISIAGVVIALLFAAYGLYRYRGGGSRLDLLLSLLIALGVALVSVVPQFFGIFTRLLGLEDRGFALLSIAVLLLFGLFLNMLGRVREAGRRNGEIVTGLAVKDYSERYLSSEERAEGVPVVSHVVNRGQGDALRTGFAIAQAEMSEIVINLDADGQYKPEELDRLVGPIIEGKADFVLGSRFMGYYQEEGSVRHVGVVFFSRMISLLTGVKVSDCTNGYRAIRVSELHKLNLREDRFNANEIILEAL